MYQHSSEDYIRAKLQINGKNHLYESLDSLSKMLGDREGLLPKYTALLLMDDLDINYPGVIVVEGMDEVSTVGDHLYLESLPYVSTVSRKGYELYLDMFKHRSSVFYNERDKTYGLPPDTLPELTSLPRNLRCAFLALYMECYALYNACLDSEADKAISGISDQDLNNVYVNNRWLYDRVAIYAPKTSNLLDYLNDQVRVVMYLKTLDLYATSYGSMLKGWDIGGNTE